MPPVNDFLEAAGTVGIFNAIIFFSGRAMLRSMKRKGQARRAFHGWYVWVWMMGGVAAGGCFLPWNTATLSQYRGAPLLIGFLTGWFGGTMHGIVALRRMLHPQPDGRDEHPTL